MDDKKITRNNKIVVLNDGQTWSPIKGASIITLTQDELDVLSNDECDVRDLHPISIEML